MDPHNLASASHIAKISIVCRILQIIACIELIRCFETDAGVAVSPYFMTLARDGRDVVFQVGVLEVDRFAQFG